MARILAATDCSVCGSSTRVIETGSAGTYCAACLFRLIADGEVEVVPEGYTNCEACGDYPASYCEGCAGTNCDNCGDAAQFCSADCAISYWGEGGATCSYCGDSEAHYCSVRCASFDNGETICTECECEVSEARCEDCQPESEAMPLETTTIHGITFVGVAAEPMQGVDESSVSLDGITFDFEM